MSPEKVRKEKVSQKKDKVAELLLHELEKSSKISLKELKEYVTPFRVAYFAVLAQLLSAYRSLILGTRSDIVTQLSIFGDCSVEDIESFIKGDDSLRPKLWRENVSALLNGVRKLKEEGTRKIRHTRQARDILETNVFSLPVFLELLAKYRKRHEFSSNLDQFLEHHGAGFLSLLDRGAYEFWYGEHLEPHFEDEKQDKKERKRKRREEGIRLANAGSKNTDKSREPKVLFAPISEHANVTTISGDRSRISPEEMILLTKLHHEKFSWMTFNPETVIEALALALRMDPGQVRIEISENRVTITDLISKL